MPFDGSAKAHLASEIPLGSERAWLTELHARADAEQQQEARYTGDPWDGVIAKFTEGRAEEVAIEEILQDDLRIEMGRRRLIRTASPAACSRRAGNASNAVSAVGAGGSTCDW
jgi:hypothetical protein